MVISVHKFIITIIVMKNKEVDLLNWELELYEYLSLNLMGYIAQEHNSGQKFGKLYNKN